MFHPNHSTHNDDASCNSNVVYNGVGLGRPLGGKEAGMSARGSGRKGHGLGGVAHCSGTAWMEGCAARAQLRREGD
jgi:hypothetical protein